MRKIIDKDVEVQATLRALRLWHTALALGGFAFSVKAAAMLRCENAQSLFEHSEVDPTDVEDGANTRKFVCEDIEGGLAFAEECERAVRLGEDVEPPAIR